jgi:hypothetical protein
MALLSFVDSKPRAYRLKAGNAAKKISTGAGIYPAHAIIRNSVGFMIRKLSVTSSQ